jgi:cell division inhibitor SepF
MVVNFCIRGGTMSQGFMNKLKNWVSGDPFEEELYDEQFDAAGAADARYYTREAADAPMAAAAVAQAEPKRKSLKVIDHPNASTSQVVVLEPRAFEESLEIIEHLRNKKSVILNLHLLDTMQSQRVVDFLSGATHAVDGHQQRIGDGVFIFTPSNVMITSDAEKGLALSDAFWNAGR